MPASGVVTITIMITDVSAGLPGEILSMECSAAVTGSIDQPTIIWLENNGIEISSDTARTVSMTSAHGSGGRYSSTLTFNPLAASHAGTYTCRAVMGDVMNSTSVYVIVQGKYASCICMYLTHINQHPYIMHESPYRPDHLWLYRL